MKVVIAIDSFKGSLSSVQAGNAAAEGIRRAVPGAECLVRPLADGGEGTIDALKEGLGGDLRFVTVTGPMRRPVTAKYALIGDTAVMEMSQAAGITLVPAAERNPLKATTFGVGEMILDAVRAGARKFIIGIGGSATNDAGCGMLEALKASPEFRDLDLPFSNSNSNSHSHSNSNSDLSFRIACDVKNPLCGPNGASAVFGPQKGATPEMVKILDERLAAFAAEAGDPGTTPGDGAAGGLGFAFRRFLGAELVPGVDLILADTKLEDYIKDADVVVTGEGRLDGQTVMGKAPIGVAKLAKKYGKKVIAFAGCLGDGVEAVNEAGIDAYFPILRRVSTLDEALDLATASANLSATAAQVFRLLSTR